MQTRYSFQYYKRQKMARPHTNGDTAMQVQEFWFFAVVAGPAARVASPLLSPAEVQS